MKPEATERKARRAAKRLRRAAASAGGGPDARNAFFERTRDQVPYLGVATDEGDFVVATSDGGTGWGLFTEQSRPEFRVLGLAVQLIEDLIGEGAIRDRVFVDVGANIGTTTVCALNSHGFGSAVCCEPEAENFRLLQANLALNGLLERVHPCQVAVSNRTGSAELVVVADRRNKSWIAIDSERVEAVEARRARKLRENPEVERDRRGGPRPELAIENVETTTIDRLVEDELIDADQVGMLWIDAEGHEGHILRAAETLTARGVPLVFEFNPASLAERGDLDAVHDAAGGYTHFTDVRRRQAMGLREVGELNAYAAELSDPSRKGFTDLLMLRLD